LERVYSHFVARIRAVVRKERKQKEKIVQRKPALRVIFVFWQTAQSGRQKGRTIKE